MHSNKHWSLKTTAYFGIVVSIILLFIFQDKLNLHPNSSTVVVYIMIFFLFAELAGTRAGIITGVILITFNSFIPYFTNQPSPNNIATSILLLTLFFYYYIVKLLRKKRLEETSAREKYFRTLVNITLQPILLLDNKGKVLFASESIKDILGLKNNLSTGVKITECIHPDDIHLYNDFLKLVLESHNSKKFVEVRFKKNLQDWIWVKNDAINLLKNPGIKAIVASIQDITFQKNIDTQKSVLLENEMKARALAEKAVKDRDEFLSIASHELKTPLTTVLLQLQATLRKISTQSLADFSGTELLNSLQIAENQSLSLSHLIKDLLNVSLASTGRLSLTQKKVDLSKLAEDLYKKYEEEIKISGCTVELINEDHEIVGHWDPVRIEQAMTNVFLNALKYAKDKKVTLTTKREGNWGIFIVKDSGMGIKEELLNNIFEPFNNANNNPATKGLGVGLFISKQIILAHGGEINVESRSGKGTKIIIKLPL